ncbi:hypothetical protein [Tenacibaculum halocynthiae]|uniref:hypothetical protein n=1 Tax=Tenacibaculum halocynthiae TaxID=1254437 RepID=UPI003D65D62C
MRRLLIILILISLLFSCKKEEKKNTELIMYKQSEMAALMNTMYHVNLDLKEKILKGQIPDSFPERYLKIHTATLTDSTDRTSSFKQFSNLYIQNMKKVYTSSKDSLTTNFNQAVNSCIACHQTTCTGPIPRIKKLLIK